MPADDASEPAAAPEAPKRSRKPKLSAKPRGDE
jgi:hypothetical protein